MRKSQSRPWTRRIPLPLSVLMILVSMPIMIPVALVQHTFVERRKRRRAAASRCERCTTVLGPLGLALADAHWNAYVAKLHKEHPNVQFRLKRTVWAICPACGQAYDYDEAINDFVPQEPQG